MHGPTPTRRRTLSPHLRTIVAGALLATGALVGLTPASAAGSQGAAAPAGATAPKAAPAAAHNPAVKTAPTEHVCAAATDKNVATCFAQRRTDVPAVKGLIRTTAGGAPTAAAAVAPRGFGPADLLSAYNLPADGGAGTTIAIVDAYDDPNAEADLALYRQQYGLPACTSASGCFKKMDQRGGSTTPAPDAGWAGEISLDLDMVSAIAPKANILLVEADTAAFSDMGAAVNAAVAAGAKYISNSYGSGYNATPGSGEDPSEASTLDVFYNHPGVVITASTGDSGYGVAYPAASPYVTAVGGTSLVKDASARGWTESAWAGAGSGCSLYEPKPGFQKDSACAMRDVADVSAVADPATGVAVYDSFQEGGWLEFGGTSASSPIIASVYASAGAPAPATYPNAYPYTNPGALNDVTQGSNGTCSPTALCTSGPGYDGPTGLGTPNGLAAFQTGPSGTVSGTVTDGKNPLALATVAADSGTSTVTKADGKFALGLKPGQHTLTVSAFGYATKTVTVTITDGGSLAQDVALSAVPTVTVTGTVTDGSGQGWPLYATVGLKGEPSAPVPTNPKTGQYSLKVPANAKFTLQVTPAYAGYQPSETQLNTGSGNATQDVALKVDPIACAAPGYQTDYHGMYEAFESSAPPSGWKVSGGWQFGEPANFINAVGTGGMALVNALFGDPGPQDATMTTRSVDLTGISAPELDFRTLVGPNPAPGEQGFTVTAELSTDGGATWSQVWAPATEVDGARVSVPLPQAANKSAVQVRFHAVGNYGLIELDDLVVGTAPCDSRAGGLVVGTTADANTHAVLPGVTVAAGTAADAPRATSVDFGDPALHGALYWLFAPGSGTQPLTASLYPYAPASATATVTAHAATETDFALAAAKLSLSATSVTKTAVSGTSVSQVVTVTNTGKAPATLNLSQRSGAPADPASGAPTQLIPAKPQPAGSAAARAKAAAATAAPDAQPSAVPAVGGGAWVSGANFPTPVLEGMADSYHGRLFAGFGYNGTEDSNSLDVYDPATGAWTALAPAQYPRESPAHGFIDGKLYVVGGFSNFSQPSPFMEIYDPIADKWTLGPAVPEAYARSGSAVVGRTLYVVGGCTPVDCTSDDVWAYDAGSGKWTKRASYPEPTSQLSCGDIGDKLYCAGGVTLGQAGQRSSKHTYVYTPASNTWARLADAPVPFFGSATAAANGQLLASGGMVNDAAVTNQGWAFDPRANAWHALPNSASATLYPAGAPGYFVIGGASLAGGGYRATSTVQQLPGYADGPAVPWLSETPNKLTVAPGGSATFTVTLNAADPSVTQPGDYQAVIDLGLDNPYAPSITLPVKLTVTPPADWGKITGTVTTAGPDGKGLAIPGATVQVASGSSHYTVHTDGNGGYVVWLPKAHDVSVIAAKDWFQPQGTQVKVKRGGVDTVSFVLLAD